MHGRTDPLAGETSGRSLRVSLDSGWPVLMLGSARAHITNPDTLADLIGALTAAREALIVTTRRREALTPELTTALHVEAARRVPGTPSRDCAARHGAALARRGLAQLLPDDAGRRYEPDRYELTTAGLGVQASVCEWRDTVELRGPDVNSDEALHQADDGTT